MAGQSLNRQSQPILSGARGDRLPRNFHTWGGLCLGFSIPEPIINGFILQPTFNIYGELVAELDADVKVSVDLAYNVDGAKMIYPPETETSGGGFTPANSGTVFLILIPYARIYLFGQHSRSPSSRTWPLTEISPRISSPRLTSA